MNGVVLIYIDVFQAKISVVGRVVCDGLGKLNAKSVLLQGSQSSSSSRRVKVDLSHVSKFSLFPGQVSLKSSMYCRRFWEVFCEDLCGFGR